MSAGNNPLGDIAAIRTAEESYLAEFGVYVLAAVVPSTGIPGATKQVFDIPTANIGFDQLGFTPEGNVFFQYAVAVAGNAYSISAVADIDADATNQGWGYVKQDGALAAVAPVHAECAATGTYTAAGSVFSTVGPCDAVSGQSRF